MANNVNTRNDQAENHQSLDRTSERSEFDQMIHRLKNVTMNRYEYTFSECNYQNIVLIGRTRTGKSTIPNMIRDPYHVPPPLSLFSSTRKMTFNRLTTTHEGRSHFFTIIDSPGLFDSIRNQGERLTNNTIKKYLDECITKDITHIHVFAFVLSPIGGWNAQDVASMVYIKDKYPELQNYFMLIVTHCEEKSEKERRRYVKEFFQHSDVTKYRLEEFFKLGIFFTGCLRPELQDQPNFESASQQAANILEMRSKLLGFLIERNATYNIHHTPMNTVFGINRRWFLSFIIIVLLAVFLFRFRL